MKDFLSCTCRKSQWLAFNLLIFGTLITSGTRCLGQVNPQNHKDLKTDSSGRMSILVDSISPRFLQPEEYNKIWTKVPESEKLHSYGNINLVRRGLNYYELKDEELGYEIREEYPGVLTYFNLGMGRSKEPWGGYAVEFYDASKRLRNRLVLKDISPYNTQQYKNLMFGYPDREYIANPKDLGDCNFKALPPPDKFNTVNQIYVSPSGFVIVSFKLCKIAGNMIVGWEDTQIVYNKAGIELFKITLPDNEDSRYPFVSSDGKYFSFLYGGHLSESPLRNCYNILDIYLIETNSRVFHHKFDLGQDVVAKEVNREDLFLVSVSQNLTVKELYIIDFKSSTLNYKQLTLSEALHIRKTPNYIDFLKNNSFFTTKF